MCSSIRCDLHNKSGFICFLLLFCRSELCEDVKDTILSENIARSRCQMSTITSCNLMLSSMCVIDREINKCDSYLVSLVLCYSFLFSQARNKDLKGGRSIFAVS